jgi:hypothetical protein
MEDILGYIEQAKAEQLTHLDLGQYKFTELPDALFELTHLESLSLTDYYETWDEVSLVCKSVDHTYNTEAQTATNVGCMIFQCCPIYRNSNV